MMCFMKPTIMLMIGNVVTLHSSATDILLFVEQLTVWYDITLDTLLLFCPCRVFGSRTKVEVKKIMKKQGEAG